MAYFVPQNVSDELVEVTARYAETKPLGIDSPGLCYHARDRIRQQNVMIKKFAKPFANGTFAKLVLKEIKTLKHLKHDNIVNLVDVFMSPSEDIYLISELMETDLQTILGAKSIEKEYVQYFLYQIMRGLKYAHSAKVFHHDLRPSQIMINRNCDLKICNFGLAHVQGLSTVAIGSNLHYMAPEVLTSGQSYGGNTDIWSVGCILAEMLLEKPLFPGDNSIHQLHAITQLLGSPPEHLFAKETTKIVGTEELITTPNLIPSLPQSEGKALSAILPNVDPLAIDILKKMIVFDPAERATASEALTLPYLAPYHDPTDEPEAEKTFDWRSVEADHPLKGWRTRLLTEIKHYHEEAMLRESVWSWLEVQPTIKQ